MHELFLKKTYILNVYAKPPKGVAPPLSDSVYNTIQIPRCKVSVEGASLIFLYMWHYG